MSRAFLVAVALCSKVSAVGSDSKDATSLVTNQKDLTRRRLHHAHMLYGFLFDKWVVHMDSDKMPLEMDGHTHITIHQNGTVAHNNEQIVGSDGAGTIESCEKLCSTSSNCNAIIFYPARTVADSDGVVRDCFLFKDFNDCAMNNVRTNLDPEVIDGLTRRVRFVIAFSKTQALCNRAKDSLSGEPVLFMKSTTCGFFYQLDRALCSDGSQCTCVGAACSACCAAHGATIAKCPGNSPFLCTSNATPSCQSSGCAEATAPESCPPTPTVLPAYREACGDNDSCSVGFRCTDMYGSIGKVCINPRFGRQQCATVGATDGGYFCGHDLKWKPMPGSVCVDKSWAWPSKFGSFGCNFFNEGGDEFERMCEYYTDGEDSDGNSVTASSACCTCGGGNHRLPASRTFLPVAVTPVTTRPGTCESNTLTISITIPGTNDTVPWRDNRLNAAFDCSWYELNPDMCNTYGREKYFEGFYARGACCACGEVVNTPLAIEEAVCTVSCSQHVKYCTEFESDYEIIAEDCACKTCAQNVDVVDPITGVMAKTNFSRSLLGRCFPTGTLYDEASIHFCANVDCSSNERNYCQKTCQVGEDLPACSSGTYETKISFRVTDLVRTYLSANSDPKKWLGCILDRHLSVSAGSCDMTNNTDIVSATLSFKTESRRQLQTAQQTAVLTVQTKTKPGYLRSFDQVAYKLSPIEVRSNRLSNDTTPINFTTTTTQVPIFDASEGVNTSYLVPLMVLGILFACLCCLVCMWCCCKYGGREGGDCWEDDNQDDSDHVMNQNMPSYDME